MKVKEVVSGALGTRAPLNPPLIHYSSKVNFADFWRAAPLIFSYGIHVK